MSKPGRPSLGLAPRRLVQFTEEQDAWLVELAQECGESISGVLRGIVAHAMPITIEAFDALVEYLDREGEPSEKLLELAKKYR